MMFMQCRSPKLLVEKKSHKIRGREQQSKVIRLLERPVSKQGQIEGRRKRAKWEKRHQKDTEKVTRTRKITQEAQENERGESWQS